MSMSKDEIEVDATTELLIIWDSIQYGTSREKMRYYVQFGCCAPSWPKPSRQARRWLRQLARL